MTRSSISWIDPDGLASTLARLGVRPPGADPEEATVVAPEQRVVPAPEPAPAPPPRAPRPAAADPAPPPSDALRDVDVEVEVEPDAETRDEEERAADGEDFAPPEGALRMRLESYVEWLLELTGNKVAFVVDRDGLPLVDRHADPDLLAIAASVMQLVESINGKLLFPLGDAVSLELENDVLTLTSVETPIGKYIVGQVGPKHLDRSQRSALGDGLRRAFRPSGELEQP